MTQRRLEDGAVIAILILTSCATGSALSASSDGDPAKLPSIGEPVVAYGPLGTLVAQLVGQYIEGEPAQPNPVVLFDRH